MEMNSPARIVSVKFHTGENDQRFSEISSRCPEVVVPIIKSHMDEQFVLVSFILFPRRKEKGKETVV